ncbi:hypothetical protein BC332_13700 [Capsicum chinense]|nr:hypothetical protein BC332_13700 [Capsicum chinense]
MPSKERAGGKELETRIPLKWKVLGLHTLVVGYTPIIEKELSSPLGRVGLSPNPFLRKKGGISATRDSPSCSPPPPDAADPYRDLFPLFATRLVPNSSSLHSPFISLNHS